MIAVLFASSHRGRSAWVNVRGRERICLEGLGDGDVVKLRFRKGDHEDETFSISDGSVGIPKWCEEVCAEHIETSGEKIYIDLR